jgi:hypothetical protein
LYPRRRVLDVSLAAAQGGRPRGVSAKKPFYEIPDHPENIAEPGPEGLFLDPELDDAGMPQL